MQNKSKIDALIPKIDAMFGEYYQADAPGAAVIVTKDGKPIFRKGYGLANVEHEIAVHPHMVFRIGSITKQFTAVATLILVEQGKVVLEDEITKFLPDYPTQGHKITVEHLLTHTSGIKSYTNMADWMPIQRNDLTLDELIAVFKDQPMEFAPDESWNYNNSGFVLLGAIIEKASGLTYEEFLKKNIFEPLGMKSAYFDMPAKIIKGRASGYSKGKDGFENCQYISMTQPHAAGSLAMSVDDLAIWDEALYTEKLITKETLKKAHTAHILKNGESTHYGYGWAIYELNGEQIVQHDGGINGFISSGFRIPGEHVYISVLTNRAWPDPMPDYPAGKIARWVVGIPYEDPIAISISSEAMDEYVGVYQQGEKEMAVIRDGEKLKLQSPDFGNLEIFTAGKDEFFVKGMFDQIVFARDAERKVNGVEVRRVYGPARIAKKTDKPLPSQKESVKLLPEVIAKYLGIYQVGQGYKFEILQEDGRLFILPPGEDKTEIFAEAENEFFLKIAPVQITFEIDASGTVSGFILKQGGDPLQARKIK
jgi:D-alanyl-D-alanine carboxypeptidase